MLARRSTVGMVFSLTTHSLVTQEMMASGLPVVELAGDNVASALGESGRVVMQASPDPVSVANIVEALLDNPELRTQMAVKARKFVEPRHATKLATELARRGSTTWRTHETLPSGCRASRCVLPTRWAFSGRAASKPRASADN